MSQQEVTVAGAAFERAEGMFGKAGSSAHQRFGIGIRGAGSE